MGQGIVGQKGHFQVVLIVPILPCLLQHLMFGFRRVGILFVFLGKRPGFFQAPDRSEDFKKCDRAIIADNALAEFKK